AAMTITVSAFNIAGDGVPGSGDDTDQDFALVCYNCAQEPTFTLSADPREVAVCTPDDAVYGVDIGSVLGFADPVTLALNDAPAGASVAFSANPVTPPGAATLTLGNTAVVGAGSFVMTLSAQAGGELRGQSLSLDVFTQAAGAGQPTAPAGGEVNVPQQPLLEWNSGVQAQEYLVEIATDEAFSDVIFQATTETTSLQVDQLLPSNSVLYWRVSASNQCGGSVSASSSFTTVALPGDCSIGSEPVVHFLDDVESGQGAWTIDGTASTWQIQTTETQSGVAAWHAVDTPTVSDQWLVSPPIEIPDANSAPTLQFWNRQEIEDSAAGCFDGAMVEISADGGQTWTQADPASLLTDPYDGSIDTRFENPALGLPAWCGDPQDWLNSVVDLTAFAGQTIQFRFRLATDVSVGRDGWFVDDFKVQSCAVENIFADGFEE
ncbi:MAG: choice-of-anchor J domain-containing protein, partial [Wenzhouxiangellaceae bacterium]